MDGWLHLSIFFKNKSSPKDKVKICLFLFLNLMAYK
jgi:hypothetical protein